jgi:hypothetical protein
MPPADSSPATTTPATTTVPRTARIIAFPTPRRAPFELATTLRRSVDALTEASRRLHDQGRDLEAARSGFDRARRQLVAESDRARAIAADGARIAAAIEGGDLEALVALRGELERR